MIETRRQRRPRISESPRKDGFYEVTVMKLVGTCVLILLSLSTENTTSHSVISRFTSQSYRRFHFKNVRRSIKEKKFIWSGYGSKIKSFFAISSQSL